MRTITYPLGMASTADFNTDSLDVGPVALGWDFVIGTPIIVVQLGINARVSIDTIVSLWDVTTQTLLGQTSVPSSPLAWRFEDIGTPISLTPGHTFAVIGWADTTNTGVPWYIFNDIPPPVFNPKGTVTYQNSRYNDGVIGPNHLPALGLGPPEIYGVPDFGYLSDKLLGYLKSRIDPMALILPESQYVIWAEAHHPHVPKVAEILEVLRSMTAEERNRALDKARELANYGRVFQEAMEEFKK